MKTLLPILLPALALIAPSAPAQSPGERTGPTILFLGDSITAAGHYVDDIETYLLLRQRDALPRLVALGLGSETVTGLTEQDHPFPRPDVHDRLDDVLKRVQPDVVVACYGMNDGIYHPFGEKRFAAYQAGVRKLISKVHASGATVTLLTPPPYAGSVIPRSGPKEGEPFGYKTPYEQYDDVLRRYGEWILTLADEEGVDAIDVRTPMLPHLAAEYSGRDPIHPNRTGHEIMAEAVLRHWGHETNNRIIETGVSALANDEQWRKLRTLVAQRRRVHDVTLLWDVGHTRPGRAPKITMDEAQKRVAEIDVQIAKLLAPTEVAVESVRRVFHNGEHNAFTDLTWFRDRLYLTFRSCPDGHGVNPTASIIVLASDDDGQTWRPAHRFAVPKRDTRDPHFLVFKDQLFVYTGTWYCGETAPESYDMNEHLGYGVSSTDGEAWTEPFVLEGTYGHYVWRAATTGDTAFLCGRRKRQFAATANRSEREPLVESALLESNDGRIWKHRGLFQTDFGNETAFLFEPDGTGLAVARGGGSRNAELCRSEPPYVHWERTDFDRYIGGPLVARWGDRYVVGGRQTAGAPARMSLYWLNGKELNEFATLPSGGDCSYPGFVELEDGSALVSYYSSHEKGQNGESITAIYLARLSLSP